MDSEADSGQPFHDSSQATRRPAAVSCPRLRGRCYRPHRGRSYPQGQGTREGQAGSMEGRRWLPWLAIPPRPAGEQLTMLLMSTERGLSHQGSHACGHLGCSGGVLLFPLQALPHQEPDSWAQSPDIVDRAGVPGDDPRKTSSCTSVTRPQMASESPCCFLTGRLAFCHCWVHEKVGLSRQKPLGWCFCCAHGGSGPPLASSGAS